MGTGKTYTIQIIWRDRDERTTMDVDRDTLAKIAAAWEETRSGNRPLGATLPAANVADAITFPIPETLEQHECIVMLRLYDVLAII